jgi:hypothetical protein
VAERHRRRYALCMANRVNLADPEFEPSDEDLARLMHDAFAGLAEARAESLRAMRARIAALAREARAKYDAAHATDEEG